MSYGFEIDKLFRVTNGEWSPEFNCENEQEAEDLYRNDFADNDEERNTDIDIEFVGYTIKDGDYVCDYYGYHDLDEPVCNIRWTMEDVFCAMAKRGVEINDYNIDKLLGNRFERTLQERSTEEGWEIIDMLIELTFE